MKTITVAQAIAKLQNELAESITEAAAQSGPKALSKAEQKQIPYFAKHVLNDWRDDNPGKSLSTKKAIGLLTPQIKKVVNEAVLPNQLGVISMLGVGRIGQPEIMKILNELIEEQGAMSDGEVLVDGTGFYDFRELVTETSEKTYEQASAVPAKYQAMVLASSKATTSAKTLKTFFENIDRGGVVVRELRDPVTNKAYVTVDYGAGDNTFGAIFDEAGKMLAKIIDGDVELVAKKRGGPLAVRV